MVQTGEEQDKEEEEKERGKIVVSYMPQYDQPCSDMTEALIALYSEFQHLSRELLNHNVYVPSKTLIFTSTYSSEAVSLLNYNLWD